MKNKYIKYGILSITLTCSIIIIFILSILLSRQIIINKNDFSYLNNEANKVILFIGDGMGENHIKIGETVLNQKFTFTSFEKQGYVSTFSKSLFYPTDSAAAATALATGKKVNNKEVSYHNNKNIKSISEFAKENSYGVGIITTDSLDGATPSAFSSHAKNRGDSIDIINGQINSNIDLFLGAGFNTYNNYKDSFIEKNYLYINNYEELTITEKKVIGTFSSISYSNHTNTNPTLTCLTKYAIDYFETNFPNGYFIMIEGAHIDKKSHDKNINEMINYLNDFNNSINYAYSKLNNDAKTTIIVTADHETGGLKYSNDINNINNNLYTRSGHTSKKVKYFIYSKSYKINYISKNIDNTDIHEICKKLLTKEQNTF